MEYLKIKPSPRARRRQRQYPHRHIHIHLRNSHNRRRLDLLQANLPIHKRLHRRVDIPPKERKVILRHRLQHIIGPLNLQSIEFEFGEGDVDLHAVDGGVLCEVLGDVVFEHLVDDHGAEGVGELTVYDVDGEAGLEFWDCAVGE